MSRYIDADHLQRWMIARWQESDPYTDRPFRADEILNQIDRELSVDIVRCGECNYNENPCTNHGEMSPRCRYANYKRSADDFCSYGSRSEKTEQLEGKERVMERRTYDGIKGYVEGYSDF